MRLVVVLLVVGFLVLAIYLNQRQEHTHLQPTQVNSVPAVTQASNSAKQIRWRPTSSRDHLQVLEGPFFTIGYDNVRKNPAWVAYDLDGPIVHHEREPTRPIFATDFRTSARAELEAVRSDRVW